jgi:proteasome accessory factor B
MDDGERRSGKRDRVARMTRLMAVLRAHPNGIRVDELARRVDMSVRTVYRDLKAIDQEIGVGVWSENGLWGVLGEDFLPPLKLTLGEAMAVFLSARLMVRYADKYDPDLASAFEKLEEGLPPALAEHVDRTLSILSGHPRDEAFNRHVHLLTRAWAERRVVTLDYDPPRYSRYGPGSERRRATVRPYLIEPSLQTHALYLMGWDETRQGLRTFKIERILDVAMTPRTFEPPPDGIEDSLRRAWDIIADQPEVDIALRFAPSVAGRVGEATWHRTQQIERQADGSLVWRATVSGTIEVRLWILSWGDEVEVISPPELRDDVAGTWRRALERYGGGA